MLYHPGVFTLGSFFPVFSSIFVAMRFEVKTQLTYTVQTPTTFIFNVSVLRNHHQQVLEESFFVDPAIQYQELQRTGEGNRFVRMQVLVPMTVTVHYRAVVNTSWTITDQQYQFVSNVSQLDPSILKFLNPSRYCQSDKLQRLANNKFGSIENPYQKVVELTGWINRNVEYLSGSTNSETSAYDTVTQQAGVCRDFAHLGIALCRALTIPARYFTGYAFQLDPPDFHACFEAWLGDRWVLFDATGLAPLNGLVKIATSRDAADVPVASIFGYATSDFITVSCQCLDQGFQPYFYKPGVLQGITYF
jgi:transglutaminase-like putative cysteine protease